MPRWGSKDAFTPRDRRFSYSKVWKPFAMASVLYLLVFILFVYWQSGVSPRDAERKSSVEPTHFNDASKTHRTPPVPFSPQLVQSNLMKKVAFVVVITNEKFVDGSLVVGYSLMQQSTFAKDGTAELVLIFPTGLISVESQQRLRCAGWAHMLQLPDLSTYAPTARLRDTFNKLYVFNLTQYSRVALFDGDMLFIRNPDEVFFTEIPDEQYVGAVGSRRRNYFQTGMMLVTPSTDVFLSLMKSLSLVKPAQDNYARDGSIIRAHFKDRYVRLNHMLSIHIKSSDEDLLHRAIGVHYRGSWKPWHNREDPPQPPRPLPHHRRSDPGQELGTPYRLWWNTYEQLHTQCMRGMDTGGSPGGYNPAESMWLMRHTAQSYQQAMHWVEERQRNLSYVGQTVVRSAMGESCDAACVAHGPRLQCVEPALSFTSVNAAAVLRHHFYCDSVEFEDPAAHQPSYHTHTRRCHVNSLDGKWQRPTCAARGAHYRRLCACVDAGDLQRHPEPQRVTGDSAATEKCGSKEWEACAAWLPGRGDEATSRQCAAQLGQWRFVTHVESIPRQLAARTIKVHLHYPHGLRAVAKLEQLSFPLEPHAEYGAYAASLLLGVDLVPPTALLRVPRAVLRRALLASASEAEVRFLERELYWLRQSNPRDTGDARVYDTSSAEATVLVSAQLWLAGDVVAFANATPPLTMHRFSDWLRSGTHRTEIAKGHATTLMRDVATMVFFDYVIGNDDRSFTHNAYVSMNTRVVLIDQGRSFCFATDPEGNLLTRALRDHHDNPLRVANNTADDAASVLMCRLPAPLLSRALRFSRSQRVLRGSLAAFAIGKSAVDGRGGFDGRLLRAEPKGNVTWRLSEENIIAAQRRLELALDHFARCANVYGLSYVTGDSHL